MRDYMDYVLRSFYKATHWNEDNSYENVIATSESLLEFTVPQDIKLNISSKSSDHTATLLSLSNNGQINGSLAYLYTSAPLTNVVGSKDIALQDAIAGYRTIRPPLYNDHRPHIKPYIFQPASLFYGRMYFPGSALEAMLIKRISRSSQLVVKCVSNERLKNNGTMTFYFQQDKGKLSKEFIFSTNEALFGFRCLYSFKQGAERLNTALYNNSSLSLGTEIWYGALNMSPGLSTALRYSTQSTYTGKPLTMTLACNPILGHISSTYSVKTSASSTFSSRYDFNIYSYDSNLSFGCELWNSSNRKLNEQDFKLPLKRIDTSITTPHPAHPDGTNESVIEAFESLVRDSDFTSLVKLSTNLNDRGLKLVWEGKFKDFLVSTGAELQLKSNVPVVNGYGFQIQYSS